MVTTNFTIKQEYWEEFSLQESDIESLYNALLETETPLHTEDLVQLLVRNRINMERKAMEQRRSAGGDIYLPKNNYEKGQTIIFPSLDWARGTITDKRPGFNPELDDFDVVTVEFESGQIREFASSIEEHILNNPPRIENESGFMNPEIVLSEFRKLISSQLEEELETSDEFVRIAGRWFPRALLVDVNIGHLNLAEAVLDMEAGGPLPTSKLLEMVDLPEGVNPTLAEFSFDFALWRDQRFDEVGPAGKILWFLNRLEPPEVLNTPSHLQYHEVEYDPEDLSEEMRLLETQLDDELSNIDQQAEIPDEAEVRLIYPHWRCGTLPLSAKLLSFFPTAYKAPRIRFLLVDGDTGNSFPGWVVRNGQYVFGLKDFYEEKGMMPGGIMKIRKGDNPGEVIVQAAEKRETREWLRTVLAGSDEAFVLALLKQFASVRFDERMAIAVPNTEILDQVWDRHNRNKTPFEKIVVNTLRELAKLNSQGNVHAIELYSSVNLVRRSPPGPILALLNSRPWFEHVGDMHFRLDESEAN